MTHSVPPLASLTPLQSGTPTSTSSTSSFPGFVASGLNLRPIYLNQGHSKSGLELKVMTPHFPKSLSSEG